MEKRSNRLLDRYLYLIISLLIVIICTLWALNEHHWFIYDDFTHLATAKFSTFSDLMTFWPNQAYNDRPIGVIFYKVLYEIFGINALAFHTSLLAIHLINCALLYFFIVNLDNYFNLRSNKILTCIAVVLFGAWPKSTFAIQWTAAIFDLLGATFFLSTLLFFIKYLEGSSKKIIYLLLMVVSFYLGLRTKEMIVTIPAVILALSFLDISKIKNGTIRHLHSGRIGSSLYITGVIGVTFAATIVYHIRSGEGVVNAATSPYKMTFSPVVLLTNLSKYFYLYFDVSTMEFSYTNTNLLIGSLFLTILLGLSVGLVIKRQFQIFIFLAAFVVTLMPVLPMINLQHILYLYIPSAFMCIFIVKSLGHLLPSDSSKKIYNLIYATFAVAVILYNTSAPVKNFRNWWVSVSSRDKVSYEHLTEIAKKTSAPKDIVVTGANSGYNIFVPYGPGNINRIVFNKIDLKTIISEDESMAPKGDSLYLKYDESSGTITVL